jgi:hypothetical protein
VFGTKLPPCNAGGESGGEPESLPVGACRPDSLRSLWLGRSLKVCSHPVSLRAWKLMVAFAAGLALASPCPAWADTDRDRAAARSAADAGADAFDQGEYQRALELFGRAEQLIHAPTHLLFMARALAKLGRLVESHETYLKIVHEQLPPSAPNAFKSAREEAQNEIGELEARIAYATVTVHGESASQVVLSIDHVDVPAAEQGIPIPMDPGIHVFSARSEKAGSDEKTVTLREGGRESIELSLEAPTPMTGANAQPPSSAVATAAPEPDRAAARRGSGRRIVAYTALGVGAVGAGIGTYFLVSSLHTRRQAEQIYVCNSQPSKCDQTQIATVRHLDREADRSRNWAIGLYAASAAVLGTGVVLLLTESRTNRHAWHSAPDVRVAVGLGAVTLSSRF